jgi:hypothetical protein
VRFWSAVWDALGLEEVYAEIPDPSAVRAAPSVDLDLGEVLARLPEWTRVHLSSVAVESLAQTRLGFHVTLEPFTHCAGSNIVVLTARRRDASSDERRRASDEAHLSSATAAL